MSQPDSSFTFYIAASAEKVWQALTQAEFTPHYFFGRLMQSEWKAGSSWKLLMEDGSTDSGGTVLECDPPRRLLITWRVEWVEEMRTLEPAKVEFRIDQIATPDGPSQNNAPPNLVRLIVNEYHPPNLDEKYKAGGRKGWPIILSGLKTLLETGQPLPAFKMSDLPA